MLFIWRDKIYLYVPDGKTNDNEDGDDNAVYDAKGKGKAKAKANTNTNTNTNVNADVVADADAMLMQQ